MVTNPDATARTSAVSHPRQSLRRLSLLLQPLSLSLLLGLDLELKLMPSCLNLCFLPSPLGIESKCLLVTIYSKYILNRRSLAALKAVDWCFYPVKHETLPSHPISTHSIKIKDSKIQEVESRS